MTQPNLLPLPPHDGALPLSDEALQNAVLVYFGSGNRVRQAQDLDFLRAIEDYAAAANMVRAADSPSLAEVAGWLLALRETSPETAKNISRHYLPRRFTRQQRQAIRSVLKRLGKKLPSHPEERRVRLAELRAAVRSGETQTSIRVHPLAAAFESVKRFVAQTELLRRSHDDPPLSEAAWAWKIWRHLENGEGMDEWLSRRLGPSAPGTPDGRTGAPSPDNSSSGPPAASQLRAKLIDFFHLGPLIDRIEKAADRAEEGASAAPTPELTNDEIRRAARVEILWGELAPGAEPLLPPPVYALPLLRAVQAALIAVRSADKGRLASSSQAKLAMCVLELLEGHYATYQPWSPPLRLGHLEKFARDAEAHWQLLLDALGNRGIALLQQRIVKLQLVRALGFAIAPPATDLSRRLCARASLLRQMTTERIGMGRRCHGDYDTELSRFGLKLRGRTAQVARLRRNGPLPESIAASVRALEEGAEELAAPCLLGEGTNLRDLSFSPPDVYAKTLRPNYERLEAEVRKVLAQTSDPELHRRLEAMRDAALRVLWTAEDVTAGFFGARRNVGLRWLLGRRGDDRWEDVLAPE